MPDDAFFARLEEAVCFIVGVPSHRRYLEHMKANHPGDVVMSEAEFFNARQRARYGRREGGRCC